MRAPSLTEGQQYSTLNNVHNCSISTWDYQMYILGLEFYQSLSFPRMRFSRLQINGYWNSTPTYSTTVNSLFGILECKIYCTFSFHVQESWWCSSSSLFYYSVMSNGHRGEWQVRLSPQVLLAFRVKFTTTNHIVGKNPLVVAISEDWVILTVFMRLVSMATILTVSWDLFMI